MGLSDKDIVALSGAHTLGRARLDRSGFGKESTKYTVNGPGKPGGQSWTVSGHACGGAGAGGGGGGPAAAEIIRRPTLPPPTPTPTPKSTPTHALQPEWLKFDNSYFVEIKEKRDAELLVLPTDAALFEDPAFK
jgi:L-ascorbate peroxidase